jgi:hypothetical protein
VCPDAEKDFYARKSLYSALEGDICVIGAGGGQALVDLTSAASVTVVELDPFVVDELKGELAPYNDSAYLHHRIIAGDGRAFLDRTRRHFDAIILEGTDVGATRPGHSPIEFENYLYTHEGIHRAIDRLSPEGVLIVVHTTRMLPTARVLAAVPHGTAVSIRKGTAHGPIDFPCRIVMVSQSDSTITHLDSVCTAQLPHFKKESVSLFYSNDLVHTPFQAVIADNRPFLYFDSWKQLVPLLCSGLLISCLLLFCSIYIRPRYLTAYFWSIGMSFIIVELCLLAVFRSAAGNYHTTFSIIMTSLSIAMCTGALLWRRFNPALILYLTIGGIVFAYCMALYINTTGISLWTRSLLCSLSVLPAGIGLGTYMPAGLSRAGNNAALWWGIDAAGTALGFVIFYIIALCGGFPAALIVGLGLYIVGWNLWTSKR